MCADPLPVPDTKSGLKLVGFIPVSKPGKVLDPFKEYETHKSFHQDDRFVFKCVDENYGVHGGPDNFHDAFKCTGNGVYDTPSKDDDPPRSWPMCIDQTQSKF